MKLKQYISKYGVRIGIVILIAVLIALSISNVLGGRAGLLKNADGALKAPVQKAATALLDWVEGIYGYRYEYDRIVEENNALRAENAELREANRDYSELQAENERLRNKAVENKLQQLRESATLSVYVKVANGRNMPNGR